MEFLKYWPVLVTLINWLLKPKCMLKPCFFFLKIQYDFFIFYFLFLERLGRMHEKKTFIFIFLLLLLFTKNQVFNIEFLSLQYKNTNRYWSKCSKIFVENQRFLKRILFEENFLFSGWAQPGPCGWAGPSHPCMVTGPS